MYFFMHLTTIVKRAEHLIYLCNPTVKRHKIATNRTIIHRTEKTQDYHSCGDGTESYVTS